MADWALVTLPARGKIRRFVEGKLRTPEVTEALLARLSMPLPGDGRPMTTEPVPATD